MSNSGSTKRPMSSLNPTEVLRLLHSLDLSEKNIEIFRAANLNGRFLCNIEKIEDLEEMDLTPKFVIRPIFESLMELKHGGVETSMLSSIPKLQQAQDILRSDSLQDRQQRCVQS